VAAADALLKDFKPDGVVGFGGYVSPPVYWAAFRNKVAVVVHEANARPGLANRWGARRAAAVGVALAGTPLPNARLVGMPLRPGLARLDRAGSRAQARRQLGLDPVKPTLLVAGGSLGALNLNQAAAAVASELIGAGAQVLHLTGRGKSQAVRLGLGSLNASQTASYHIMEYLESMELALAAADLALQRAGAATVAELACAGLPAVLVPLRIGNGEQRHNAAGLVKAGAAVLVTDDEIGHWVTGNLAELLTSPDRLAAMSQAASSIAIRDGAERLVDLIEEVTR
jgi:UDP-N-acetylglucosamine:LPS N-acetylglucosamine transferase